MILKQLGVDKSWTLFLDRDGVINVRLEGDYVKSWKEFIFIENTLPAIKKLSAIFGRIIIVTNQQGIGKKLMTHEDLDVIHGKMNDKIIESGGKIDAVYSAVNLAAYDMDGMRKPATGMGLKAKSDFPKIDFKKSIMAGDAISDMQFGKSLGMITILVEQGHIKNTAPEELVDFTIASLNDLN